MSSYVYLTFDFFCKFHSLRVCQGFLLFFYAFEIQDLAHKLNYRLGFVERSGRNWKQLDTEFQLMEKAQL